MATPKGSSKPRFLAIRYDKGWRGKWEYYMLYSWCPKDHYHNSQRDALLCAQTLYLNWTKRDLLR